MTWKGERQRHGMAARGIGSKSINKTLYTQGIHVINEETDEFMDVTNGVRRAYADANDYGYKNRMLDYEAEFSLSPELAVRVMEDALECNGRYNAFTPKLLMRSKELFDNPKIVLAREGSVAVYIEGEPKVSIETIKTAMKADEAWVMPDGALRLWWD